jgi:hypothetical protein
MITEEQLFEKYPKIFQDYEGNRNRVNWYGVRKGWLHIIDWLCGSIQYYIDNTKIYESGVKEPKSPEQVTCTQMKEKFGGLRFYTNGHDDKIEGMISFAEYLCDNTCDRCSSTENLGITQGWISVCCKSCAEKEGKYPDKWIAKNDNKPAALRVNFKL